MDFAQAVTEQKKYFPRVKTNCLSKISRDELPGFVIGVYGEEQLNEVVEDLSRYFTLYIEDCSKYNKDRICMKGWKSIEIVSTHHHTTTHLSSYESVRTQILRDTVTRKNNSNDEYHYEDDTMNVLEIESAVAQSLSETQS